MSDLFLKTGEMDYTVSNAIRCSIPGRDVYTNDWRYSSDNRGWTSEVNIADISFLGGSMHGVRRTNISNAYVEQPFPRVGVTPTVNYIELVLRVKSRTSTQAKLQFIKQSNIDDSVEAIDALGQYIIFDVIQDEGWHFYRLNPNPISEWQGLIERLRLFPFLNGARGDEFFVQFIRIVDASDDSGVCISEEEDFFTNVPSPCTGAGRAASLQGTQLSNKFINVTDFNNTLKININDLGLRTINIDKTNRPVNVSVILEDVERKINNLVSSGFMNTTVRLLEDDSVRIEGGIRGSDTSISLSYTKLAEQLGFFNKFMSASYTLYDGVDDDGLDSFYEVNNELLRNIKDSSTKNSITFNPEQYIVEAGNPFYSFNFYRDPIDYTGFTLIDYLKPANNTGVLNKGFFYGTLLQSPQSKLKIFRPQVGNKLAFIGEVPLTPSKYINNPKLNSPPLPANQILRDYECDIDISVEVGDLIAVSNVVMYSYASWGESDLLTFMIAEGDIISDLDIENDVAYNGNGMKSLPLYARSNEYRDRSKLFFDLGSMRAVDKIVFSHKPGETIKVGSNLSSSVTDITVDTKGGEHGYWRYLITFAGIEQVRNVQTTIAQNIDLLTDGIRTSFGGNDDSYFFLNGDGQEGNTDFVDPGLAVGTDFYNAEFDIIIDISPDFDKEIGFINLYFVEALNWVEYGLFYEKGGQRIPFEIVGITFDDRPIPTGTPYYLNPLRITEEGDLTDAEVQQIISLGSGIPAKRKATYMVKPVEARRVVFEVYSHFSTKMSEIELASPEVVSDTGYTIKGSDIFDVYVAGEDLNFKQLEFAVDETVESGINNSYITIGKPIRYAMVDVRPPLIFDLYNVKMLSEKVDDHVPRDDKEFIESTTESTTVDISYNNDRVFKIKNESGSTADLIVDILRDDSFEKHNLVLYSDLNSKEDLENPDRGTSGFYKFSPDINFKVTYDVLQNRQCWGAYNYNFANPKNTQWFNLGTQLTDSGNNNISQPLGGVEQEPDGGNVVYTGEVESDGTYEETFSITYTVHINTDNGLLPDLGADLAPTFTVTSEPAIDDVSTPIVIENTNTLYPVGTLGVFIRWNTFAEFGQDDLWKITAVPYVLAPTKINARDYGYVVVDVGQEFTKSSTELSGSSERIGSEYYSWSNDDGQYASSNFDVSLPEQARFGAFGSTDGPLRWLMLSWDFTQDQRGGYVDVIKMFVNEPVFYSDRWWEISVLGAGSMSRERNIISGANKDRSAVKFVYNANQTQEVIYKVKDDAEWVAEELWSFRDYINFNLYVDNYDNLDYILLRFGTNSSNYFEWSVPMNSFHNGNFTNIDLKFSSASITGSPEIYDSINYLAFVVGGVNSSSPATFICDNFKVRRSRFDDVVIENPGMYLNGDEFVSFFPVEGLTLAQGTVECWFMPDYNHRGYYEHVENLEENAEGSLDIVRDYKYYHDDRIESHPLITLMTGLDFHVNVAVQTSINGLVMYTNNKSGDDIRTINDIEFDWYTPHHLAVVWKYNTLTQMIDLRLYVDNVWVKHIYSPWIASYADGFNIILGGSVDPELFHITANGSNTTFEKLRAYNYPIYDFSNRFDFDVDINEPIRNSDLFSVDINGSGFNQRGASVFPVKIKDVANGDTVEMKVRFIRPVGKKIPQTLTRRARIDTRWEVK